MARTILTSLLLWALTTVANGQPLTLRNPSFTKGYTPVVAGPATYLLKEDFDGASYGATLGAWSEFTSGGTVDEDYAVTALDGTQSLFLSDAAAPLCENQSASWTYVEPFYVYFMLRVSSVSGANGPILLIKEGSTTAGQIQMSSTGQLRADGNNDSPTAFTTGTLSINTTYHVWVTFNTSVSPCAWEIAFSTDGTKPTSGANYLSGTSEVTTGCSSIGFTIPAATIDVIVDKVRVDDVPIGSNPS